MKKNWVDVLEDEKIKAGDEIRQFIREGVRSKTWRFLGKLNEFCDVVVKQARPACEIENIEGKEELGDRLREDVRNEISCLMDLVKSELIGFASNYIEKEVNFILYQKKSDSQPREKIGCIEKKKHRTGPMPQFDVKGSLKNFLYK